MHNINISRTTVQHMCNWKVIQILTICLISKGLLFFIHPVYLLRRYKNEQECFIRFKDAVQYVCKQRLCLHFGFQNIEFYSTTIYIFMIIEYNKLRRDNNQALQEHKMK